jgi:hypothetical protein
VATVSGVGGSRCSAPQRRLLMSLRPRSLPAGFIAPEAIMVGDDWLYVRAAFAPWSDNAIPEIERWNDLKGKGSVGTIAYNT